MNGSVAFLGIVNFRKGGRCEIAVQPTLQKIAEERSGPRFLDSLISEISTSHYAAVSTGVAPK